jgi:hypothetical protein
MLKASKVWHCDCGWCGRTIEPGDEFIIQGGEFFIPGHQLSTTIVIPMDHRRREKEEEIGHPKE